MAKRGAPYSEEFKEQAVRVARTSGQPLSKVAAELGVSERHLRRWVAGKFISPSPRIGLSAAERAELKQLRRRVKTLEQEQEILKKAADFFARETR
jgi:transposase